MMTSTPARILDVLDSKGSLVPGKDADVVIFDASVNIQTTIVKGTDCFSSEYRCHQEFLPSEVRSKKEIRFASDSWYSFL
jgi:predicted amidohydrolase YtcJ